MEERKYRYDAFISYRHTELDKFVAENLIKELEGFKIPKSVAKKLKGKKSKIERVFRDREELPLTNNLEEPIVEALENSEWLIVICSPRLPESMWCKKEIETFISLRGREHVLAVLIEGEPSESFPEELLYKVEEVEAPDGTIEQRRVPVEPLAADFRGKNKKEVLKAMKTEKLRVLAAMFGVPYDDLRQRHRERKMRRIVTVSLLVGFVCLLFGVYSTMTALRINEQKKQIETQSEQILQQSQEIQAKSEEIQKQNEEIIKQNDELALRQAKSLAQLATGYFEEGNNKLAIQTAVEALTESDGIKLPYTSEAQYILTDSLRAYDTGAVFRSGYQYEISGRILDITISQDGRVLAIKDANGEFYLFDLESKSEIANLTKEMNEQSGKHTYTFLNGNQIAFIGENCIKVYDMTKKEITNEIEHNSVCRIFADNDGKYLCAEDLDFKYTIYDSATLECIKTIEKPTDKGTESSAVAFTEGVLVDACYDRDEQGNKLYTLYCWDIESGQLISQCYMGLKQLTDIQFRDGVLYTMNAVYAEGFVDCDTYITAISMESGEVLWEKCLQGEYARRVKLPAWTEGTHLFTATGKKIRILDMQTGENAFEMELSSDILEVYSYTDSNNFLFLLQNGELSVISLADNYCYDLSNRLECKSLANTHGFHTSYGMVMHAVNDNKITVYTAKSGAGVVESQHEAKLPQDINSLTVGAIYETAQSYGLERPEYINSMYYSDDQQYCMIQYWDGNLVIYDTVQGKVLNTIEDAHPTTWHVGKDAQGCTYLLGYGGCYVLDENMEPIAWIQGAKEIDVENRRVYIHDGSTYYEAPVYTLDELLKMANEQE